MNKIMSFYVSVAVFSTCLLALPAAAVATDGVVFFGSGKPGSSMSLPAGEFRSSLEALPGAEHARAVQWLQSIEFTSQDLEAMRLDSQGGVYYADRFNADTPGTAMAEKPASAGGETLSAAAVLKLHSNPGAPRSIFVDFSGGVISDTAWNRTAGIAAWNARPYDLDNEPGSFNAGEIAAMAEIWQRISEDFAPFNVDVTTEAPGPVDATTVRILITHSTDGNRQALPEPASGSVAYMNVTGFSLAGYYSPALVYYNNLSSPASIAEASSHATGHLYGLSHDSLPVPGMKDNSSVSWSPIMGPGPFSNVTRWSKGDYRGGINPQNDIGILVGALDRRRDDHDDSRFGNGTPLQVDTLGHVTASTPATDPDNQFSENKGVIEVHNDIDVFVFDATAGLVDLKASPAWSSPGSVNTRGANLAVQLSLFDSQGKKLAQQDPFAGADSGIKTHVSAGRYLLEVSVVGNAAGADAPDGSIGQYFINGTIPAPDTAGRVTVSAR